MDNNHSIAEEFLSKVLPGKTEYDFVFADALKGTPHEEFNGCTYRQMRTILVGMQEDGRMLYVKLDEGIYVAVAGTADLRESLNRAIPLDNALKMAADARAAGMGEWAPLTEQQRAAAAMPSELAVGHRTYLMMRGLLEDRILACGIHSVTDKKELTRLFKRTQVPAQALAIPHYLDREDGNPQLRLQVENPAGGSPVSLWTAGAPVPYFPKPLLDQDAYSHPGPLYLTFDEIDAHVIEQHGMLSVAGDTIECFRDPVQFSDTGEEHLHPSVQSVANVRGRDAIILYYPRAPGKRKSEALRLARWLHAAGAARLSLYEVKQGNLRKLSDDRSAFLVEMAKVAPVTDDSLENPYTTLRDVLPQDILSHPVFAQCKGLYVPDTYDIDQETGAVYTTRPGGFMNGVQVRTRVLISRTPILPTAKVRDLDTNEISCTLAFYNGKDWTTKHVPLEGLSRRNGINQLAKWGIAASDHNSDALIGWLHDMLELNQQHDRFVTVPGFRRTGWYTLPTGEEVFAMPDVTPGVYTLPSLEASGENDLLKGYGKISGTLEGQLEALRIVAKHRIGRIAVTEVFRSMLMPLLDGRATRCMHIFGESTGGKTIISIIAMNVYGDGRAMMLKGSSTIAAIEASLAARTHTTSYIDEITQQPLEHRTALLYMAADGCGKSRSTRTGRPATTARWVSGVLTTAEHPMQDEGMTQGAQARVLELRFEPLAHSDIALLAHRLNDYGHMVRKWIEVLPAVKSRSVEYKTRLYDLYDEGRTNALRAGENSRTADNVAELVITHAVLMDSGLGELMGLPDDDGRGIRALLYSDLHMQGDTAAEHAKALRALQSYFLANPAQVVSENAEPPKGPVAARVLMDGSYMVERGWLTSFLKARHFSTSNVRQAWEREGVMRATQRREGTKRPHYYVFNGTYFDDSVRIGAGAPPEAQGEDKPTTDTDASH